MASRLILALTEFLRATEAEHLSALTIGSVKVILVGPPGAGKTSCGRIVASLLSCKFLDSDRVIEETVGCSVEDIFKTKGEQAFRLLENQFLEAIKMSKGKKDECKDAVVLSVGGGLPVFPGNMDLLLDIAPVFYLTASLDNLAKRLAQDHERPLLARGSKDSKNKHGKPTSETQHPEIYTRLEKLLKDRSFVYERAHHAIATDELTVDEVAKRIVDSLG